MIFLIHARDFEHNTTHTSTHTHKHTKAHSHYSSYPFDVGCFLFLVDFIDSIPVIYKNMQCILKFPCFGSCNILL